VFIEVEEKCSVLGREKNELQNRIEENDEEVDELMKKFKATVQQVSSFVHFISVNIMFKIIIYSLISIYF